MKYQKKIQKKLEPGGSEEECNLNSWFGRALFPTATGTCHIVLMKNKGNFTHLDVPP
jgi:hypothetical protein